MMLLLLLSARLAARDEQRLGAMLFALHLNAAAAASAHGERSRGLTEYHLGGQSVRFCTSPNHPLLLVLFVATAASSCIGTFLASELLRQFESCFDAQLRSLTTGGAAALPSGTFHRKLFAAGLRAAVGALPNYIHDCMLADATSAAAAFDTPPWSAARRSPSSYAPRAIRHSQLTVTSISTASSDALCSAFERGPSMAASTPRATRQSHHLTRTQPRTERPFDEALGTRLADEQPGRRQRGGGSWFGCCGVGRGVDTDNNSTPSPPMQMPRLWWRDATLPSPSKGKDTNTIDAARLQLLVRELHSVRQQCALRSTHTVYSALLDTAEPSSADGDVKSDLGQREECSLVMVLLRKPMLLRVRTTLQGVDARGAAEVLPHGVALLTSAIQPWLASLSLSLAFLARLPETTQLQPQA